MSTAGLVGTHALALAVGIGAGLAIAAAILAHRRSPIKKLLERHFAPVRLISLVITGRKFHARIRADLQRTIDQLFVPGTTLNRVCGIRQQSEFVFLLGVSFSELLADQGSAMPVAMEYEDVDIGEEKPVRCAVRGLWLLTNQGRKHAVLMSSFQMPGETPMLQFQVATAADNEGTQFSDRLFAALESAVQRAVSYRGKVLSLEAGSPYSGKLTGVTVQKLRSVGREEVILPQKTLDLLDRNILRFVQHRGSLAKVGQATKKGLLFYGPPGNGKTHTIHYLVGALKGHTTLLITAEQMGLLGEYTTLARLLQPSVVVIEDVDLIARERTQMDSPCQESLLNRLLNEMDGLKEDADILFILTTNRPAELEQGLAARPGRVDQAIEFPLPDENGREKLARLYSRGVTIAEDVLASVVSKTENTSAAFIKELMRRAILHHLERADEAVIELRDVESALEELLVSGGSLNLLLLGAHPGGRAVSQRERLR